MCIRDRRKFYEVRGTDLQTATRALAYIRLLYDIEDEAGRQFRQDAGGRSLSAVRLEHRQARAVARLAEFHAWLQGRLASAQQAGPVLPRSAMGRAIGYVLNQWDALCVYTTDGDLSIDNNVSENALRRVALGRKNWLFCGSDGGGRTAAVLLSMMATCERHKVEPLGWLRDVLTRLAAHPASRLEELLPEHWTPAAAGVRP